MVSVELWIPWSDSLREYYPDDWTGSEEDCGRKCAWRNRLDHDPGDWRPVRIPPPGTIEVLEEVEVLAASGNWFNEPIAREVLKRVQAAIAKANGESA